MTLAPVPAAPAAKAVPAVLDQAEELRLRRAKAVKGWVDKRNEAERAREVATRQRDQHQTEIDEANVKLREILERGDRFVIDGMLVSVNEHKALLIEPVVVYTSGLF